MGFKKVLVQDKNVAEHPLHTILQCLGMSLSLLLLCTLGGGSGSSSIGCFLPTWETQMPGVSPANPFSLPLK